MIGKSTTEIVLEFFFENPSREFHLRELSRLLKLSMPTIISVTDALAEGNLIAKKKGKVMTTVAANREHIKFVQGKRVYNLKQFYASGLLKYLSESYNHPKLIILFGSYSRGEDVEKSDIDTAVITNKRLTLDFSKYEKILGKGVSVHEIDLNKVSDEFKANLANGIVLEGSW